MALPALVYICSLFMIGRNCFSLFFQIRSLFLEEKKEELKKAKDGYFVFVALSLTAILGIISGISLLFPNLIFGYYLFLIVSGMMIYSYMTYAGITYDEKNWLMFAVCIVVILTTITLATLLSYNMATGIID
ncbi:MAG: hypothetical protein GF308_06195 [Candidatus Heimdallarchaeota archaeon]|nr:hypothetical protein [Candidatus Heimdallarchaeota archaeon]